MHCWKAYEIQHYLPHLRNVGTLRWKNKNSNFLYTLSRNRRKCEKFHFKWTACNFCMRVTVYAEWINVLTEYVKYLNIRRHSYLLFTARSAAAWPPISCAFETQLFHQLLNTTPSPHNRTTLSRYVFATNAWIENRKRLVKQHVLQMSSQYGHLLSTNSWGWLTTLSHPRKFHRF